MNGYVCFWAGQRTEVFAGSSYEAQQKAVAFFQKGTRKKVKGHEVAVMLAEKSGEQVTHVASE